MNRDLARQSFEQWYNAEYIRPIIPADRTEGGYQHPDAQAAWDAWQAALSHAEGEAQPVAWGLKWPEDVGVNPHTVFRSEAHAQAYRAGCQSADTIMVVPLYTYPAPQVAVPEGWKLVPVEPTDKMMLRGGFSFAGKMPNELVYPAVREVWDRLLSEVPDAPTAPAGEPECGCCGRSDQCDTDCDAQQPVSDPDGLPEPLCYLNPKVIDWDTGKLKRGLGALTYSTDNPADNWKVPVYLSAPAPDEREIAALALERHADNLIVMAERDGRNSDRESQQTWEEAAYFAKQEAARLRAGKEGQ